MGCAISRFYCISNCLPVSRSFSAALPHKPGHSTLLESVYSLDFSSASNATRHHALRQFPCKGIGLAVMTTICSNYNVTRLTQLTTSLLTSHKHYHTIAHLSEIFILSLSLLFLLQAICFRTKKNPGYSLTLNTRKKCSGWQFYETIFYPLIFQFSIVNQKTKYSKTLNVILKINFNENMSMPTCTTVLYLFTGALINALSNYIITCIRENFK